MTAKATAAVLLVALGGAAALAVTSSRADEQLPYGAPPTVYRTVIETKTRHALVDGKPVGWWAHRARRNGHLVRTARITLHRIRRSLHTQVRLGASGLERAFLCVHGFEGSWADPNPPYYGGLQMDWDFMAAYAAPFLRAYGPANNWTPAMQLAAAERAYLEGRGFRPWPNTARMCGLL